MDALTFNLADCFREGRNKYYLINIVARRARALKQGARPAVPYQEGASDAMQTAIEELVAGRISAVPFTPEKKLLPVEDIR